MAIALSRASRFLGVVLFESAGPSEDPWHAEETVIVRADDEAAARVLVRAWAERQCAPVQMPNGGEWMTRTIGITYIFPMLFDISDDAVTPLRVRQIADMEAQRRADYRIDSALTRAMGEHPIDRARDLANTISEGINFVAFVRSLSPGAPIGQQRALFVLTMDELSRALTDLAKDENAKLVVAEDSSTAVRELRNAVSAEHGAIVTSEMHALADRVLSAFRA